MTRLNEMQEPKGVIDEIGFLDLFVRWLDKNKIYINIILSPNGGLTVMNPMVESKTSPTKQTKVFVVAGTYILPQNKTEKKVFGFAGQDINLWKSAFADETSRQNIVAVTLHRNKGLLTVGFP